MVPVAQRIARLDPNFIMPPSLTVREKCGAVWRSKQIGACANSFGPSFGRAYRFEKPLRLVRFADTIRLPASARNAKSIWSIWFVVAAATQNIYDTREKVGKVLAILAQVSMSERSVERRAIREREIECAKGAFNRLSLPPTVGSVCYVPNRRIPSEKEALRFHTMT